MRRIFHTLLFTSLILYACSPSVTSPQTLPLPTTPAPQLLPTVSTPHIEQPPDGEITATPPNPQDCGYQWANQELPKLSDSFQESIQELQTGATARAYVFGENCLGADGSVAGFSAMETDFEVTVHVDDLSNESDLGEWIVKVMGVIENIPMEQIIGPRPGRVTITFQSGVDQSFINFYVDQYQALPTGLSNSKIHQSLQTPQ